MERTPKHGLTPTYRNGQLAGWVKRINKKPTWICGAKQAATPDEADTWYEKHFTELWQAPKKKQRQGDSITAADLCDRFMDYKRRSGVGAKTIADCQGACDDFCVLVGDARIVQDLTPAHFGKVRRAWAARLGVYRLKKYISEIREMFRWAAGQGKILAAIPDYGGEFERPRKKDFRKRKKERREEIGLLMFTPEQIAAQLNAADPTLKAMILLGLNCGYGNTDCSALPWTVIDLDKGVIDYARSKTYSDRRAMLWPETIEALKAVPKRKPASESLKNRVFLSRRGTELVTAKDDRIGKTYRRFLINLKQWKEGLNFYSLRRTFRTYADEIDGRAADLVMGHITDADMGGVYTQEIRDDRLHAIAQSVRASILSAWLSGERPVTKPSDDAAA